METTVVKISKPFDVPMEDWKAFLVWHRENPSVWEYFEKFSLELINQGISECGSITILGRVRYECLIEQRGEFKVNNNYAPMYSRVFVQKYPNHSGFFKFRGIE